MITYQDLYANPRAQAEAQRLHAWLHIPLDSYDSQAEAMEHAHSIASRTKHRMEVRLDRFNCWRIRLGKGPLS